MKTKNKTILMFILVFIGITLCDSLGWVDRSLATDLIQRDRFFTCANQGPAADKIVEVQVTYDKSSSGEIEIKQVLAVDKTEPDRAQPLKVREVEQPYFIMKGKDPTNPDLTKVWEFRGENTGPRPGSIICTKNNYPVFVRGNQAWFIY